MSHEDSTKWKAMVLTNKSWLFPFSEICRVGRLLAFLHLGCRQEEQDSCVLAELPAKFLAVLVSRAVPHHRVLSPGKASVSEMAELVCSGYHVND